MKIKYKKELFIESLPQGFINPSSSEKFLRSCFADQDSTLIGTPSCLGMLCRLGYIQGEYFTGEEEPAKSATRGFGFQIWQRLQSPVQKKGWIALPGFCRKSTTAFIDLEECPEEYWLDWSQHARRYRKKWHNQRDFIIGFTEKEMFIEAYRRSTLKPSLRALFIRSIHRHSTVYGVDAQFLVVKNKLTREIIAGLMVVDDIAANRTFHPVAFITQSAKNTQAALGLVDYWVQETKKKGIRFVDLGIVWMPGDPPSWKGYSQFKMHFHPKLIRYQVPLLRFFWNSRKG